MSAPEPEPGSFRTRRDYMPWDGPALACLGCGLLIPDEGRAVEPVDGVGPMGLHALLHELFDRVMS